MCYSSERRCGCFSLFCFFFPPFNGAHCSGVKTAVLCWILTGETNGSEIEYYDVYWNMLSKHLPRTSRHSLCAHTEEGRGQQLSIYFLQYLFMMVGGLKVVVGDLEGEGVVGSVRWRGSVRKDRVRS